MPLLADYAITPDVFDLTSYSNEDACAARLETIREAMLTPLLRAARATPIFVLISVTVNGASALFRSSQTVRGIAGGYGNWSKEARHPSAEGFRASSDAFPSNLADAPVDDPGLVRVEALATAANRPLTGGIIVTPPVKQAYRDEPLVARIDRLSSAHGGGLCEAQSVRLERTLGDYRKHLEPVP